MKDHTRFLKEVAAHLRQLASRAPEVAESLRELADDLEIQASRVARERGQPDA